MTDLAGLSGTDSASATEIPPRTPAQVRNGTLWSDIRLLHAVTSGGAATASRRATSTIGIVATATSSADASKRKTNTSRPISRNSTEFRISSISVQSANTYV